MKLAATGIVTGSDGSVLMIKRDDTRTWTAPGGSLDAGELPTEAVVREVEEETGYKVYPVRLVGLRFVPLKPTGYLSFVFRCLLRGGSARTSAESLEVGFVPAYPVEAPMVRVQRQAVESALAHDGGPPVWERYKMRLIDVVGKVVLFDLIYPIRRALKPITGRTHVIPVEWQIGAATIIRNEAGDVLWARRQADGRLTLPHGEGDPMEPPWEAAVRVTRETTGLTVDLTDLAGVYLLPKHDKMVFVFSAEVTGGALTAGADSAEFAYFAPGEEPADALPRHVERVADATEPRDATLFRRQGRE